MPNLVLAVLAAAELRIPLEDPVQIIALATAFFVLAPLLFERLRVPGMIGLIVAGAVVGPNGLGLLARDESIVLLGTVGLLYLMFMAGVEIDLHGFNRYRKRSVLFGAATFLIPMALGTVAGRVLGYGWGAAVLLASMLASHTLVGYPIASRLGIGKNEAVTTAVGGTIVTDVAALLVLAVIAASVEGELGPLFWGRLLVSLAAFTALVMLGLPRLARWFFRHEEDGEAGGYLFVLAALFASAVLAELAGVEAIIGAFLAGLALNRLIPEGNALNNRLHFFGNAFFIPFFLLSVGMLVDVRVLMGSATAWKVMGAMVGTVLLAKWSAARLARRAFGYTKAQGGLIFGLTVPQAAATLAAALIGYRLELFDTAVLNGTVMMILITCTVGPWLVERDGRRVALEEAERPYAPGEAPQRILIPISNPDSSGPLLDLAMLLRSPDSDEPLLPIVVVPPDGGGAAARVAQAEKVLSHAVVHAAGAEVPVTPLTRVDRNVAAGLIRGMAETRATMMLAGWEGEARRLAAFESSLRQVLEKSEQEVVIARLGVPLNTTARVRLLLPPAAHRAPGFYGSMRTLKLLASRLGATLELLTLGEDETRTMERVAEIRPELPLAARRVDGWTAIRSALQADLTPSDLVVVFAARRGTVAWHRELARLPRLVAEWHTGNVIAVYSAETAPERPERRTRVVLPRSLTPERVVFQLEEGSVEAAVERMLTTEFAAEPERAAEISRAVLDGGGATELRPGVAILHARLDDLPRPLLFLTVGQHGVRFGAGESPARLLFLLLTQRDRPWEHLEHLASVTEALGRRQRVEALGACRTREHLFDWFRAAGDLSTPVVGA